MIHVDSYLESCMLGIILRGSLAYNNPLPSWKFKNKMIYL